MELEERMEYNGAWDEERKDELKRVFFDLGKEWENEAKMLRERLRAEGISCTALERSGADLQWSLKTAPFRKREAVVLTDSPAAGKRLSQEGIVCFGCQRKGNAWFEGAVLVLEGFDEVDARYLEEWMSRAQGRPARIAETERLLLREMDEKDLPELVRIGREGNGLALLSEDVFSLERLSSYWATAYRLQGYGLWSVLYEGRVIGCCGFAPYEEKRIRKEDRVQIWSYRMCCDTECAGMNKNEREAEHPILELQYMLDTAYRRQGFGTEMCQAALQYADERLGADTICLRIRTDNAASQALAQKLGFQYSALHF